MASLGSASVQVQTAPKVVATDLIPSLGMRIDTGVQIPSSGSVTPKRYVRLAGVAVPIQ